MPSVTMSPKEDTRTIPSRSASWRTVVWDDPINLMGYVTSVFQRHFGYSTVTATRLMLEVHESGRAIVSTGMRERMEADVVAMHGYGLRATLEAEK